MGVGSLANDSGDSRTLRALGHATHVHSSAIRLQRRSDRPRDEFVVSVA